MILLYLLYSLYFLFYFLYLGIRYILQIHLLNAKTDQLFLVRRPDARDCVELGL